MERSNAATDDRQIALWRACCQNGDRCGIISLCLIIFMLLMSAMAFGLFLVAGPTGFYLVVIFVVAVFIIALGAWCRYCPPSCCHNSSDFSTTLRTHGISFGYNHIYNNRYDCLT